MERILADADSMNRAYIPMTSDSLLLLACNYYDQHGSPNERMRSHYLLGCVYRDLGEAPQALRCYQDALDAADTISSDCDYVTLLAVYGQMADLYHYQDLPLDELNAADSYHHYACLIGDTLKMIRNYELMAKPYELLKDTEQILIIDSTVAKLYEMIGCHQEAVSAMASTINVYLIKGRIEEAHQLMLAFERESGLFDQYGNIRRDRTHYYNTKGNYYRLVHQLDSSEYYYRKLMASGYTVDACRGLLSVFRQKKVTDSVYFYSRLYEIAVDSLQEKMRTKAVKQMTALYDYNRNKQLAEKRRIEALHARYMFIVVILTAFFIALYAWWRFRISRIKNLQKLSSLTNNYIKALTDYQNSQQELAVLEEEKSKLEEVKHKDVIELKEQVNDYEVFIRQLKSRQRVAVLLESDIVKDFREKAKGKLNMSLPTDEEWRLLTALFGNCLPIFYNAITKDDLLSTKEIQTCMLIRLNFSEGEIAVLLDTTIQRVSNIKSRVNKKMFSDVKASTLRDNMKSIW